MANSFKPRSISSSIVRTTPASYSAPETDVDSETLARTIAEAADDRKGADISVLGVAEVSYLADYFVIVTGFSNTQVRAIARSIENKVAEQWQRYPRRLEGLTDSSWVLIDYGDVIAHVFLKEEREYYNLEAFWGHGDRQSFAPDAADVEDGTDELEDR